MNPAYRALGVIEGWLQWGVLLQKIDQAGAYMVDMVAHRGLGAFAVVGFEGSQNGQVGIGGAGRREVVGLTSAEPDLILNILEHATEFVVSGGARNGRVKPGVFFNVLCFIVRLHEPAGAFDTFGQVGEQHRGHLREGHREYLQRLAQIIKVFHFFDGELPQAGPAPRFDMDQAFGLQSCSGPRERAIC